MTCCLLITFANSLNQDQDHLIWIQTIWHWLCSWKNFLKSKFWKNQQTTTKAWKITQHAKNKSIKFICFVLFQQSFGHIMSRHAWTDPENSFMGVLTTGFLVVEVFHRGPYKPPLRSNLSKRVQNCLSRGSATLFQRKPFATLILQDGVPCPLYQRSRGQKYCFYSVCARCVNVCSCNNLNVGSSFWTIGLRALLFHMCIPCILFIWFDSLCPSQQFFNHVGMGLPGLDQY